MSMNRINNPSQLPQGVVEGYQQQNTNMFAARVGLDTTAPFDNGTIITIPVGGVVEANGVMYSVASEWSQTKPNADTAYWIVVVPSEDGLTAGFELATRPGVWSPERNGCYFTSGDFNNCRTLNWVSTGTLSGIPSGAAGRVYHRTTKINRDMVSLQKGWYTVRLESGGGGGNGGNGARGPVSAGGAGGVANVRRMMASRVFFADKPVYEVKVGGSGFNGSAGGGAQNQIGAGGGGGGGSGEESVFDGLSTGMVPAGRGGDGGDTNAIPSSRGGPPGGNGEFGIAAQGARGGVGGLAGTNWGGGGGAGSGNAAGTGGAGGNGGRSRADGAAGGLCSIWVLGD